MAAIVNVLGMRRSGTTMLHLMLANGPEAVACGEIGGWFRLSRYQEDATPPEAFRALKDVNEQDFHKRALEHHDAGFVIDSTKSLDWALSSMYWAEQQGLDVFNVLIWKDPVYQAFSKWKRGQRWEKRYISYHKRLFRCGFDFFTVSYGELVEDPTGKLEQICRHVGIPYFEGKERFWESHHDIAGSSPGVTKQSDRGSSKIEKEPLPAEFKPIAQEVRERVERGGKLREVLQELQAREVSRLPALEAPVSHRYRPTYWAFFERCIWKVVKRLALRLRWNVLEPRVVRPGLHLMRRFIPSQPEQQYDSFDPDSSR